KTGAAPRKRQRTGKQSAQRKRGRLSEFVNLPTDLFNMIASYLFPLDILSLARSNRFFRNLLMTKSSRNIWLNAMKNVEALPPCPSNMSEPQYVALLYTNVCSSCGTLSRSPVDEYLLVRFCARCQNDELMRLSQLPEQLHDLFHYSAKRADIYNEFNLEIRQALSVTIRDEATVVHIQYNELARLKDKSDFNQWSSQRRSQVERRREFGDQLASFLSLQEAKREDEKQEIVKTRRAQIEEKLLELGWTARDIKFRGDAEGVQQWHELVEMPKQPKPLTDRIWKNLYKKLEPLLEVNRQEHIERARLKRKAARRADLEDFLVKLQRKEPPLLKVKPRPGQSTYDACLSRYERPIESRDVFPFATDALAWPFVEEMNDQDLEVKDFRAGLEQHIQEINAQVVEWQAETRNYLLDLLQAEDIERSELLRPPKNTDPGAFARLSDDQKLLLRADSLFYLSFYGRSDKPREALPYDKALRHLDLSCHGHSLNPWESDDDDEVELPDLGLIRRHTQAQAMARILLADLGKPDASFIEINQLHYTCERCHNREPMEWTRIINHYLEEQSIYDRLDEDALARDGVVYGSVHSRVFHFGSPMIKPSRPKGSAFKVPTRRCCLCAKESISLKVIISETKIHRHLLDVHAINDPEPGTHYDVPTSSKPWEHPEFEFECEAGAGEVEEVEADNEPEKEEEVESNHIYLGDSETDLDSGSDDQDHSEDMDDSD
ncbi:unnamed protein product, partial [Rhizoctonia solani]